MKHGHWIGTSNYLQAEYESFYYDKCSCCGEETLEEDEYEYCPHCGARMDEPFDPGMRRIMTH